MLFPTIYGRQKMQNSYHKLHRLQLVIGCKVPCNQFSSNDKDLKGNIRLSQTYV